MELRHIISAAFWTGLSSRWNKKGLSNLNCFNCINYSDSLNNSNNLMRLIMCEQVIGEVRT